jgi:drug/metabolite transporter (DMT)-like permease
MHWLESHLLAIGSALVAALCAAVGIVLRQRAGRAVAPGTDMTAASMDRLIADPLWWAGTGAAIAGYAFQALALANGSLLLVQPLLVSALLFALPLSAALNHQSITRAEWMWAAVLTAGLAVFVLVGQPHEGHYRPPVPAWTLAAGIAAPAVIVCVVLARRRSGALRAMLLAVAVAVLLGMIAVLTKVCTHRYAIGGWHHLLSAPAIYVLAVLAVVVTVLQQEAFHAGALQASVPIMLVGEPLVAVGLGVLVLGEYLSVTGTAALVLPAAVAAMVAAAVALGRDSGMHTQPAVTRA